MCKFTFLSSVARRLFANRNALHLDEWSGDYIGILTGVEEEENESFKGWITGNRHRGLSEDEAVDDLVYIY